MIDGRALLFARLVVGRSDPVLPHPISKLQLIADDLGIEPKKMTHLIERHLQGCDRSRKENPRPPSVQDCMAAQFNFLLDLPQVFVYACDSPVPIVHVVEGRFVGESTNSSTKVSV